MRHARIWAELLTCDWGHLSCLWSRTSFERNKLSGVNARTHTHTLIPLLSRVPLSILRLIFHHSIAPRWHRLINHLAWHFSAGQCVYVCILVNKKKKKSVLRCVCVCVSVVCVAVHSLGLGLQWKTRFYRRVSDDVQRNEGRTRGKTGEHTDTEGRGPPAATSVEIIPQLYLDGQLDPRQVMRVKNSPEAALVSLTALIHFQ